MISVCIATYNGENFIQRQINSILPQLNENDEIVISDADSTDKTTDIINSIGDKRIKLLHYKTPSRYSKNEIFNKMDNIRVNFENALMQARGDVILLSDQDDLWHSNKVKRICELLKEADCIVHDCVVLQEGKVTISSFLNYFKPGRTRWSMFIKSPFMGCCMAFNRSVLERSLPFPNLHIEHDTWIGMCAYKVGKVKIVDEVLIDYFRHGHNASPIANKKKNPYSIMLLRRFYMLLAYLRF